MKICRGRWTAIVLSMTLLWEPSFCWRWKTTDAIIQEVWPDSETLKFKRASVSTTQQPKEQSPELATSNQDDEDMLVFEGHYFKPDEVLPPPPVFMVAHNNWRGSQPKTEEHSYKQNLFISSSGRFSPSLQKFTKENAKELQVSNKTEELSKSDNESKGVVASASKLEEMFIKEQEESKENFKDAPKCFTPTDTPGHCVPFRQCFPVVFNVIDGDLRNPGLAKLLYQASGPCNATLELSFALSKSAGDKSFLSAGFYNQTICCPAFKHNPDELLNSWRNDVRSVRLSSDLKNSTATNITESLVLDTTKSIPPVVRSRVVGADESSVEIEDNDDDEDDEEDDNNGGDIFTNDNISKQNISSDPSESSRRGDREKLDEKEKKPDVFSPIPAPNLAPAKCHNQPFGMPRGHWPWMVVNNCLVALLVSGRHICSGALISERHVLTAAHCVYQLDETDVRKLRIILGDRVMYSFIDGPHLWRKVNKIITHVNYNQRNFASDIAILKMNIPVSFTRNIQPISLPIASEPFIFKSYLNKAIVAGWSGANIGQISLDAKTESETVVDFMDKKDCHDIYRGFAVNGMPQNTFCVKTENKTCVADSGAPMVVRMQNCWRIFGIMSWGLGCSHFPEVYTDVSKYITWITKHTTDSKNL